MAGVGLSAMTSFGFGASKEARMWRLPQQMLPHRFKMRAAALHLLADRMHVAEAPFKGIIFENRGGTGFLINGLHHFA